MIVAWAEKGSWNGKKGTESRDTGKMRKESLPGPLQGRWQEGNVKREQERGRNRRQDLVQHAALNQNLGNVEGPTREL